MHKKTPKDRQELPQDSQPKLWIKNSLLEFIIQLKFGKCSNQLNKFKIWY